MKFLALIIALSFSTLTFAGEPKLIAKCKVVDQDYGVAVYLESTQPEFYSAALVYKNDRIDLGPAAGQIVEGNAHFIDFEIAGVMVVLREGEGTEGYLWGNLNEVLECDVKF